MVACPIGRQGSYPGRQPGKRHKRAAVKRSEGKRIRIVSGSKTGDLFQPIVGWNLKVSLLPIRYCSGKAAMPIRAELLYEGTGTFQTDLTLPWGNFVCLMMFVFQDLSETCLRGNGIPFPP